MAAHETPSSSTQPAQLPVDDEMDPDDILAALENEDDSKFRAQRTQELRDEAELLRPGTGTSRDNALITLITDDDTLRFTTEHERAVVHFSHPDFARCSIMDSHCQQIAEKHAQDGTGDVSFAKVDVQNAPFVVEKLGVRVLPCVIGFVKGVVKGRITGFEGLCWDGNEAGVSVMRSIEQTFVEWTVLKKRLLLGHDDENNTDDDEEQEQKKAGRRGIRSRTQKVADEDDDWD